MTFASAAAGGTHSSGITASMLTLELFTPQDDDRTVYLSGNFNDWTARDARYEMKRVREGHFRFTFQQSFPRNMVLEYKYTKGGWEGEELGYDGFPPSNRHIEHPRGNVSDLVPQWKQHSGTYNPMYFPEIQIVAKRFNVPQLRRRRRISILLPWNYKTSGKRYPVLYLQDGQNLFEDDAPFGTWGVDKQLAALAQQGKGEVIVVAIDHGGKERIREFMPYDTHKWGDGLGRDYAQFLAETLKPYIDKNFRTLVGREHTGIGGSSMGGLISIFAGMLFPHVFSKYMIFSPSLWVSPRIYTDSEHFSKLPETKVYLYVGEREGSNTVNNVKKFKDAVEKRGMPSGALQVRLEVDPMGLHNEGRWGKEFPKAMDWLY
jgi:predicted alpha/beta superfamily hydrolase